MEQSELAWMIAGVFTLLASLISFAQVRLHLRWNTKIRLRKYLVRCLLMVPVYAVEAWIGLRWLELSFYTDVLRECYEALVIFSFFMFLVEFLGGEGGVLGILGSKPTSKHLAPFCCLPVWERGTTFYYHCKVGVLQYCVLKPLCALAAFVLKYTHNYEDGDLEPTNAYPYLAFVYNASQIWAMYCLIFFYIVTQEELAPLKPVPKFIMVKSIVFFTFWQAVGIAILVKMGFIEDTQTLSSKSVAAALQDFIVCIEMFIAAIAHHYAFSYKDFMDGTGTAVPAPIMKSLFQAINVADVYAKELRMAMKGKKMLEQDHQYAGVDIVVGVATADDALEVNGTPPSPRTPSARADGKSGKDVPELTGEQMGGQRSARRGSEDRANTGDSDDMGRIELQDGGFPLHDGLIDGGYPMADDDPDEIPHGKPMDKKSLVAEDSLRWTDAMVNPFTHEHDATLADVEEQEKVEEESSKMNQDLSLDVEIHKRS